MSDAQAFSATIHLGNDAMSTPLDVAEALRKIADRLDGYAVGEVEGLGCFQTIHDANGNDVGRWKLGYVDRPGYATPEEERLEELRVELRAERISYGELAELQSLTPHIAPGDVELLEAAGVPEFPEGVSD